MPSLRSPPGETPLDVLLVEDNPGDARLFREMLADGELDADSRWEQSLEEGLAAARETPPDLLVVDLGLPDSRGLDTVRRVAGELPGVPVVVMTGASELDTATDSLGAGASEYLRKDGLTPALLSRTLRMALERHRLEREADRQRSLSRAILQSLPEHIAVLDPDGRIEAVNEAWERFADTEGGDPDGYMGESYLDVTRTAAEAGSEGAREMLGGLTAVLNGERDSFTCEYPCHSPEERRWFRMHVTPLRGASGGAVVSHIDITERKERERFLETLTDNLPGVLYRCRNEAGWPMEYLSEGSRELTGYAPGELIGEDPPTYADLIHPADRERLWDQVQAAIAEDRPFQVEYRLRARGGEEKWIWEQGRLVPTASHRDERLEGYLVDATERIRSRLATERAEDKWSTVFETVPVGIVVSDAETGRMHAINAAFEELFGYPADEVEGRTALELEMWEDPDLREDVVQRVREEGGVVDVEGWFRTAEGERRRLRFSSQRLELEGGERTLWAIEDITEDLRRRQRVESQANRQRVLAKLGERALTDGSRDDLIRRTVEAAAGTLETEYAAALELAADGERLLLRSGVGWDEVRVGDTTVPGSPGSLAGYTLRSAEPVIIEDLDGDDRFEADRLLADHDVTSGISVTVGDPGDPWGVLCVHTSRARAFLEDEVDFLQTLAHMLAAAIRRDEAREEIEQSEERYRSLFEESPDPIVITTTDGDLVRANEACLELFGYDREELAEIGPADIYVEPANRERILEDLKNADRGIEREEVLRTKSGEQRTVKMSLTMRHDPEWDQPVIRAIMRDVTQERRLEDQLKHQALHDPLTGLANRALLDDRLDIALARSQREEEPMGLLMLDLDNFKRINDQLGHTIGDQVLREVGRRLETSVRDTDTVVRWGGDEFVVVVPELDRPQAIEILQARLRENVEQPITVGDDRLQVGVTTAGVVRSADGAGQTVQTDDPEDLLRFVDLALHRAKQQAPNEFYLFRETDEIDGVPDLRLEQDLRRGVRDGEIVPFYQPIFRVADGSLWGLEALARWRHPDRGLVPPGEFIPLAERVGLIHEIGASIFRQSFEQAAEWIRTEPASSDLKLTLNLSAQQLQKSQFGERVGEWLETTGIPPSRVVVEVTETTIMRTAGQIDAIRGLGIGLFIDDFGTGYSTYTYLRDLDAQGLKIDMSFVQGLPESSSDLAIVESVVTLSRRLGLDVVAEGIEEEAQLQILRELGCRLGQGFHLGRPLPATEIDRMLGS